ncbi:MAG TPA: GerMN domain-containing protein [Acidimicrobiia bacterium]|nr:GerMN domain-containing protein [Acidimicrobiia bacterium]
MKRSGAVILSLALLSAACGTNSVSPPGAGMTTTSPAAQETTTTTPTSSTVAPTTTTQATTTTTTPPSVTTTTSPPTTPTTQQVVSPTQLAVAPWFLIDEGGQHGRTGPFLAPVYREVAYTKAVGRASLEQLFAGPTTGERESVPAISSTIPAGVTVLGLTIREGIATVDLSSQFEGDDDSPVVAQRMAQVVFTLTSIPFVNEVLFRQDGKPIPAQTGAGQLVTRPVMKADYLEFAAAITVERPVYGGTGGSPLHVTGFGAVFEAAFNYAIVDDRGLIIAEGHAMTTNGMGWGGFDFTIPYKVDSKQTGALIVWVNSAENGSQISSGNTR